MTIPRRRFLTWTALGMLAAGGRAVAAEPETRGRMMHLDVSYAATPPAAVAAMLRLAGVGANDVVYDLGSGDGRIVIAAVRDFGARAAIGIELNPQLVREAGENARKAGVADRVRFIHGSFFKEDFSAATVLTLYLSPRILRDIEPRLHDQLRAGARVVSWRFGIGDWTPDRRIVLDGEPIYLWTER